MKYIVACILITLIGCNSKMVNYNELEKPLAIKKEDVIEINVDSILTSSMWVQTKVDIKETDIYLSGWLTRVEQPRPLYIKIPDIAKTYRIYWVDDDGSRTEILFQIK